MRLKIENFKISGIGKHIKRIADPKFMTFYQKGAMRLQKNVHVDQGENVYYKIKKFCELFQTKRSQFIKF